MKKTILLVLLTFSINIFAQDYTLEEKSITGVYDVENKTKSELFSAINKWISLNYNSAQNVIQMNDKESGDIIIKGINSVVYKNTMKSLYPRNKHITETTTTKFNHIVEFNIKENKYRVNYKIVDIASKDLGTNNLIMNIINFKGVQDESINDYNNQLEQILKTGMISKKKRESFKALSKGQFEELNTKLIESIKTTMQSINESVKAEKKDNW